MIVVQIRYKRNTLHRRVFSRKCQEARYPAFCKRGEQQVLERWAGYVALDRVLAWSKAPMLPGKTGDG